MTYNKFFDVHLTLSTLGSIFSAFVPIILSYVVYCVTKTQRDISANQYKLDIYTKRRDVFDDLNDWCSKNNNSSFHVDELIKLKQIILDVEILFSIKSNVIKNNIDYISDFNNNILNLTFFGPEDNNQREHEIRLDEGNIAALWWEILEEMQNYHAGVKESLRVPQNPY
ncbi:hypothetical protein NKW55_08425 [Gluconobacter kondonii]|uniref:hypothetical protein n=1 Tax=Gluconobacter kondonii TaxID=941463 RepID=UPI0020A1A9A8|nr:hypothetical protein [Gluconobacter kondonii]MCP1236631.1 hypothetical protein [Gluconobacter kondonii]